MTLLAAGHEAGVRQHRLGTPAWIRVCAGTAILAALVLGLVLASATRDVRDGVDVIGHRTAPQVTATEDLYFVLADLDAQLANVLLAGDDPALGTTRTDALKAYEERRAQASADLQQATTVAGDDETAQHDVREIMTQAGRYQGLAAQAIALNDREHNPAGRPSDAVLALHRQATDVMHGVLATAHELTEINSVTLEHTYTDRAGATVTARWWLVLLGLVLLGALIVLQVVLRVRLRRRVNVPVLVATAVAAWLTIGGVALMASGAEHLRAAKHDAFDSLLALRQARAVSYDANADESRYLIDPGRAAQYEKSFLDKSESLAGVGASAVTRYDDALATALDAYRADRSVRLKGFFGTELNNITFPGEREAAERTLATYQRYQLDDRIIRTKARTDLRDAIAFCTSTSTGSSNYHFYAYDKELAALIDINQRAFDQSISDANAELNGWTGLIPYGGAALFVLLVVAGVWPRLAEYR